MNRLMIIGNVTRDPELKTVSEGLQVCSFTVAVNKRAGKGREPQADFFRVTAWRQLAENCSRYLAKGRKVAVVGSVTATAYKSQAGEARASLEVTADDVEFLTPKEEPKAKADGGYVEVVDGQLPWDN